MTIRFLPLILIGMLIPSFVEVDTTLPGFPEMAVYFKSTVSAIQYTLIFNFVGLCLFTLICGPLSDALGRRKILIFGSSLFFLASLGCSLSSQLNLLYLFRFLQGFGCSAIWVVGFVICRDYYTGDKSIQIFGMLNSAISTSLIIAPIFGTFIVAIFHWRAAFFVVVLLSFISFMLAFMLPEKNTEKVSFSIKTILSHYLKLSSSLKFLAYALTPSLLIAAFIAYISTIPFLYLGQMKMSFPIFALNQSVIAGSLAIVGWYSGKINQKIGSPNCIMISIIICSIGCTLFIISSKIFPVSPMWFTLSMTTICIGSALQSSMVFARSLELFPGMSGSASSLITFFRLILFSICTLFASKYYTGNLSDTAQVISLIIISGLILSIYVRYDLVTTSSGYLKAAED